MRWTRPAIGLLVTVALAGACAQNETTTVPEATTQGTASVTASPAAAGATVRTESNAKFGTILVDSEGRSLYTFDKDTDTTIACTGACASTWPPVLASGGQAPTGVAGLSVRKRPDGDDQVAHNGKPLYRYSGDSNPGDTNGDGVGGVWHIAKAAS